MLHKELWAHFLAYNLLRTVQAQAAEKHDCKPWQISFKGTLQTLSAFAEVLAQVPLEGWQEVYDQVLRAIVTHQVGDRPDRIEPRAVKRRPKVYRLLTEPREAARAREVSSR